MDSMRGHDFLSLELDYLLGEFYDYATVELVANVTHLYTEKLVHVNALHDAIMSGQWNEAESEISELGLNERARMLLHEQHAKELFWRHGLTDVTIDFVQSNVKDPCFITNVAATLLSNSQASPLRHRQSLCKEILLSVKHGHHIQALLDNALQLKPIVCNGKLGQWKKASVQSFVYSDIYLRVLDGNPRMDCMTRLERLASKVTIVNEFHTKSISTSLGLLLQECMKKYPKETIILLRNNPRFSRSIQGTLNWNPLSAGTKIEIRSKFDFLYEYKTRRDDNLPSVSSLLELGRVMQRILDPYSVTAFAHHDEATSAAYEPLPEFPLKPAVKINLGYPIWSVSFSSVGRKLAAGTSPFGSVYLFSKDDKDDWTLTNSVDGIRAAEQILFSPHTESLLLSRGGAITGLSFSSTPRKLDFGPDPSSDAYGDLCWHPTKSDLFFAIRDSEKYLNMFSWRQYCLVAQWKLIYFPLVIAASGEHIIILTGKMAGKSQHLVLVNYESSEISDTELPALKQDGMYTTLKCSQWDPRTIMLLGSPNCIFLIDKLGKRRTRVIYGPKPKKCLLRATFCGPMDKYIMTSSEESNPPRALIFSRFSGELVTSLEGHRDIVNDVEWIPPATEDSLPNIVTGADDNSLIIYS